MNLLFKTRQNFGRKISLLLFQNLLNQRSTNYIYNFRRSSFIPSDAVIAFSLYFTFNNFLKYKRKLAFVREKQMNGKNVPLLFLILSDIWTRCYQQLVISGAQSGLHSEKAVRLN